MTLYSFHLLVPKQEEAEARLGLDAHFSHSSLSLSPNHPSSPSPHPPAPISSIPFVLPQGGAEELEESSQWCPSEPSRRPPLPSGTVGSPLEKSHHCPRCVPSQEQIRPLGSHPPCQPCHRNYFLGFCPYEVHQIELALFFWEC